MKKDLLYTQTNNNNEQGKFRADIKSDLHLIIQQNFSYCE